MGGLSPTYNKPFSLPLWERVGVRSGNFSPSPLSAPIKGGEAFYFVFCLVFKTLHQGASRREHNNKIL